MNERIVEYLLGVYSVHTVEYTLLRILYASLLTDPIVLGWAGRAVVLNRKQRYCIAGVKRF